MSEYDFTGLTRVQQNLLTFDGWQIGSKLLPQPSPKSVSRLIERGLVTSIRVRDPSPLGNMFVTEYYVPTDVHMAWCEHCSRLESKPGRRKPA